MSTYLIVVRVSRTTKTGWTSAVDVPTFFLDGDIQAIVDADHAARIARKTVDPYGVYRVYVDVRGPLDERTSQEFEPQ